MQALGALLAITLIVEKVVVAAQITASAIPAFKVRMALACATINLFAAILAIPTTIARTARHARLVAISPLAAPGRLVLITPVARPPMRGQVRGSQGIFIRLWRDAGSEMGVKRLRRRGCGGAKRWHLKAMLEVV